MIDHVLVPVDDSPLAQRALDFTLEAHPEADITILHVVDYVEGSHGAALLTGPEELRERATKKSEELLDEMREHVVNHHGEVTTVTKFGNPSRVITEYADDHEINLIVIGSHSRSIVSQVVLGDVAQTVVRQASVPVTVVR